MNQVAPPSVLDLVQKNCPSILKEKIGHKFNVDDELVWQGYNPVNIQFHHLRMRNGELELIMYNSMSPMLIDTPDPFALYLNLIKYQTEETTQLLINNVPLMAYEYNDAKVKYGISPVTIEEINKLTVNGVLKPFRCIFIL